MTQLIKTPFGHEIDRTTVIRLPKRGSIRVYKAVLRRVSDRCQSAMSNQVYHLREASQELPMHDLYGHTIFPGYHSWPTKEILEEYLQSPLYKAKGAVGASFLIPEHAVVARKLHEGHELIISSTIIFEGYL